MYGFPEHVHITAEKIIDREIYGLCNMVEDAIRFSTEGSIPSDNPLYVTWDDVENVFPQPNVSDLSGLAKAQAIRDFLNEYAESAMETPEFPKWVAAEYPAAADRPDTNNLEDEYADVMEDALDRADIRPQEILQWFIVSDRLHDWLRDEGEPVVRWGTLHIWGRTTAGQAVILDGTIQRIVQRLELDWS